MKTKCIKTRYYLLAGLLVSIVVIGVGLGLYYWYSAVSFRILSLNVWGIPHAFGSKDKQERIQAIAKLIGEGHYDVIFLQELWMRGDHAIIKQWVEELGYHMTPYNMLSPNCDGLVSPKGCNGLAIVTLLTIKEMGFTKFSMQGSPWKLFLDGEFFAGKGVGWVTVAPTPGITVDFLVTHTISEASNYKLREAQVTEIVQVTHKSLADFLVLGGDFNAAPNDENDQTYGILNGALTDARMAKLDPALWNDPNFATFSNSRNSYYDGSNHAAIYDYIFVSVGVWVNSFFSPVLYTQRQSDKSTISVSDHEAIVCHVYLWK